MTPAFRGTNQIRTGVNGFADRYLTTRTWYPFAFAIAKLVFFSHFSKFIFNFIKNSNYHSWKFLIRLPSPPNI